MDDRKARKALAPNLCVEMCKRILHPDLGIVALLRGRERQGRLAGPCELFEGPFVLSLQLGGGLPSASASIRALA